ncbi:MAG TPA: patatin-like phospholipase family protein, partial [Flavitalea sp.]|nr:patatin-like phospholipase family protein [Flavitalea sp.]
IRPYAMSGSSSGAIAAALYASGKTPEEILELMKKHNYFGWGNLRWRTNGFFSMDLLRKTLTENLGNNDFASTNIKLYITVTDIIKAESVIYSSGEIADIVIASASVPALFEPVKMGNKLLVDGGVLNNFPIEPLMSTCDIIIGSYVNHVSAGFTKHSFFESVDILDRCFHLAIARSVYSKVSNCDLFIDIPLNDYGLYDMKRADEIFEIGYKTASLHREKLKDFSLRQKA